MRECAMATVARRLLMIAAAAALASSSHLLPAVWAQPHIGLPDCPTSCGNVSVPYPFGISPGCYLQGFNLTCDTSSSPPRLLLGDGTLKLVKISLDKSTVRALGPNVHLDMTRDTFDHGTDYGKWGGARWGLGDGGPYSLESHNEFILWGCFFLGQLWLPGRNSVVTTSCDTVCNSNAFLTDPEQEGKKCSGIGCCQAPILGGRASYDVLVKNIRNSSSFFINNNNVARPPPHVVLIAEKGWFAHNMITKELPDAERTPIPVVLSWAIFSRTLQGPNTTRDGNATCPADLGNTTICHSSYSSCTSSNRLDTDSHYTCRCWDGYQGNPYLPQGCQDIDECTIIPGRCYGSCTNMPGTYSCECPHGTHGNGNPQVDGGCVKSHTGLRIGLAILESGALFLLLSVSIKFILRKIKEHRQRKQQKFLNHNRRQLLQQLACQRADIAETMIVTSKDLQKATNNFDKGHELSDRGHFTLYTGTLSNLHIVVIKKSNIVAQREIDNFINEVAILSQINHKNIVKLVGCCLETKVPLLVYEFITSGTLYDRLHAPTSLSWRDRLRISIETARALAYLHSFVSMKIIHGDIKSSNVLLDENLTVKLSDFGASRSVHVDQTGLNIYNCVHGTSSYLEQGSGHLCEKCDVYSFGMIRIELLTRKKPISYRSTQGYDHANHFTAVLSEHNLDCILDPQVTREGDGEVVDVALLAAMCVKFIGAKRPTMRQVEMILESIYSAKEYVSTDMTNDEYEEDCTWENDSSTRRTDVDATRIVLHSEPLSPI